MTTTRRRAAFKNRVVALLGIFCLMVVVSEYRQVQRASAQGANAPLRGGVDTAPEYEAKPMLLNAPTGQIFRTWARWVDDGGGTVLLASSPDGATWRTILQIDPKDPKVKAERGHVAVNEGGDIALAYRWTAGRDAKHIRLARSLDAGKTWTIPADNLDAAGPASDPQVVWGSGRTVLVAWGDRRRGNRVSDVYVRRSPDAGATWEPERPMSPPVDEKGSLSVNPHLIGDGKGRFWLVWRFWRVGGSTLQLARSEDNGRTWSPPQSVSGESRSVFGHSLERGSDNRLLLTWQDQKLEVADSPGRQSRVYATASKDGGISWSAVVEVDGLSPEARTHAVGPSSALTPSGEAWITWNDARNGRNDVFVAHSRDGGATWGAPQRLDADGAGTAESRSPQLAGSPDGRTVAVVWEDDRTGLNGIYGRIRSGGQWSAETQLARALPHKQGARRPVIVSTGRDAFYVAWEVWDHSRGRKSAPTGVDGVIFAPRP